MCVCGGGLAKVGGDMSTPRPPGSGAMGGGGGYAQSASEAIFRARTYSHDLFSPVMILT